MSEDLKDITHEELTRMIAEGFANTASKADFEELKGDLDDLKTDVKGVDEKLTGVDERLTIVERKLDKALYREFQRIDKLETDMKTVKEKLGIAV